MKVLYVFAGARKGRFEGVPGVDYPDTQLYGFNHLQKHGIDAAFKETNDLFPAIIRAKVGFRIRHFLMFFATFGYDIVFGSALMYMLFWKRLIPRRTKFVLLNFSLKRLLESNKDKPLKLALIHWLLKGADEVVNVSAVQQKYLAEHCPYLHGKMSVVFGNVDIDFYHGDRSRSEDFFAVGRDNGRDYKTLIEAARRLPQARFEIACGERNVKGITNIPQNVTVHYNFRFPQVKKKLETARAMLLITHPDTFSDGADCSGQTVLMEAMASGVPIIMTRKAYLPEYVTDGVEALVVEPYDVEGIVKAVRQLDDESFRAHMGKNARERAEKQLSSALMGERLARVFRTVLARSQS